MRETLERLADCFACSAAFRRALYESDETMYFLLMEVASHPHQRVECVETAKAALAAARTEATA